MKKRFLVTSILMLLLTVFALSTSTYAWFSMNNKVTVTGMVITAKVENNLAIAASSAGNDKVADSAFSNALNQDASGKLQPVSTIDGINYFYTNDAAENGQKTGTNPYTALVDNQITVNAENYKGYVDYVFELKATNTSASSAFLNLSKLNLLYAGTDATTHAFRVAAFVQEEVEAFTNANADAKAAAYPSAYAALGAKADSIFAPATYEYFTEGKAVKTTTTVDTITAPINTAISKKVAGNKTKYFKVTIRLWLEGEDTDCYNTKFVELTDKWTLDIAFTLNDANTSAINQLGSAANATNTSDGTKLTAALTNDETAASYQWYKVGVATAIDGATESTYTPADDAKYYCAITTVKGNVYYTPATAK